ncbi:MAG: putative monovalent cation/H+ antiporter subunit A [Alphaproteobacteria bacterium]
MILPYIGGILLVAAIMAVATFVAPFKMQLIYAGLLFGFGVEPVFADVFHILVLGTPLLLAVLAPWLYRKFPQKYGWVIGGVILSMLASVNAMTAMLDGPIGMSSIQIAPSIGISLSFAHVSDVQSIFTYLILVIGALIMIYAAAYMQKYARGGTFMRYLLLFKVAMLGIVMAGDVMTLFIFWEFTSITSFLLIGFNHDKQRSRRAAVMALVVTGGGGLALLAGMLLMGDVVGSYMLQDILASSHILTGHELYPLMLGLVLLGAFTKSAQFPFNFWLPNAMEAPTPVSAFLHSATMVKAGVYLVMLLTPALGGTELWRVVLTGFGAVTLVVGAVLAVRQSDLKLMLAQTTVASLGLLVMMTGLAPEGAPGAVGYLLAHALFKGALFMIVGAIDLGTGTREITALRGIGKRMPLTFLCAALAMCSMSGLPFMVGFHGKEAVDFGTLAQVEAGDVLSWWPTAVAWLGNGLMTATALAIGLRVFLGPLSETPKQYYKEPLGLLLGPIVLTAVGVALGVWVAASDIVIFSVATGGLGFDKSLLGDFKLHLIPAITPEFIASLATLSLGVLVFWKLDAVRGVLTRGAGWLNNFGDDGFDKAMVGIVHTARVIVASLQTGVMRQYVMVTMLTLLATLLLPVAITSGSDNWLILHPEEYSIRTDALIFTEIAAVTLMLLGTAAMIFARTQLAAIVSAGVLGAAVASVFLLFSAPDLAFTQVMVETLSVVIIALVLTKIPLMRQRHRAIWPILRDGGLALACGGLLTLVMLEILLRDLDMSLSAFFAAQSVPGGFGRNIVNVILVDFRALDTMGEIAVVVVAGLASAWLIKFRPKRGVLDKGGLGFFDPPPGNAPRDGDGDQPLNRTQTGASGTTGKPAGTVEEGAGI